MSAHRSSLFGGPGTGASWDCSSLTEIPDPSSDALGAAEDSDEYEGMEDNIIVAAGPSLSLPGSRIPNTNIKRQIIELNESENEEDEEEVIDDEIIVVSSSLSGSKRRWDDESTTTPSKRIKTESPTPETKRAGSSYLHGVFASRTKRTTYPVAPPRSLSSGKEVKPFQFTRVVQPARHSVPGLKVATKKATTPFIEIEDSDEEAEVVAAPSVIASSTCSTKSHGERGTTTVKVEAQVAQQKEKQRLTSLRLRQEAMERKMKEDSRIEDVDTTDCDDQVQMAGIENTGAEAQDEGMKPNAKAPEDTAKAEATTDCSMSFEGSFVSSINPIPALTSIFRKTVKPVPVLKLRPPPTGSVTTHVPSLLQDEDEEAQRKIRPAKAKQREESVAAQIRAHAAEARKAALAVREAREKKEVEEKAESEAQIAREARQRVAEAKKREDEAKEREDGWKMVMERKRQEEADKRQKVHDDLAALKAAGERKERVKKEAEARKREEKMRRKQAEARSMFAGLPITGGLALPSVLSKEEQKVGETAATGHAKMGDCTEPASAIAELSDLPIHNGETVQSGVDLESKASREERVRHMKGRNARNKVAAAEQEPAVPEQSADAFAPLPATTTNLPPTKSYFKSLASATGPISLTSAAGTAAVAKSKRSPSVRNNAFSWNEDYHKSKYGTKLSTMTTVDIKLFVWSEEGVHWNEIGQMFADSTGREYATYTLQCKVAQIRDTLLELDSEPGLLNRAVQGEHDALAELNAMIDAKRPTSKFQRPAPVIRPSAPISHRPTQTAVQSGLITAADIKLMRLRSKGMIWASIMEESENMDLPFRSKGSLRNRYRQAKELVEHAGVDEVTLDDIEAGDQDALDRLNDAVRLTRPNGVKTPSTHFRPNTAKHTSNSRKVDPTLGEIVPHDIQLMQWRDSGLTFSVITGRLQELTGVYREHHVAQYRYKKVKAAIDHVRWTGAVDDDLLDDAMVGEQAAIERLNIAVHGVWPVPEIKVSGRRPKVPYTATKRNGYLVSGDRGPADTNSSFSSESIDEDFWANTNGLSLDSPVARDTTGRSTEGGKTIGPALFRVCFGAWADQNCPESDSEEGLKHKVENKNTVEDKDKCHYIYQVQRREISQEEAFAEEPVDIEDMPWLDVGLPLESYLEANLKADKQAFVSNDPETATAIARGALHDRQLDKDGLRCAKMTTKDAGVVEVRVEQRMRSHGDGVLPKASAFELSRTVFFVKRSTAFKPPPPADTELELFGEEPERDSATPPDGVTVKNAVYTTLDLANAKAIDYFTKEVQFPIGIDPSLTKRDTWINAAKESFWRELRDKGEKAMFDQEVGYRDMDKEVRVWVEPGSLDGPRNIPTSR
ncbi:hypothetical protein LTR78_003974 [Recurvomyces mirabilis]|uniref:Uncharacterized protein n=1 Tax=Recurvomyces mirabilis TaxID=574656 RepID=A0AAE0WR18_9PEZI|nr:hypothetical protein LTR78_003974 [Recurvomyces mirabilis]KAK5153888.1 hypothetical protein LTS14_007108 [Recurvomyces mirabilis]